jgi:hypothetical protein
MRFAAIALSAVPDITTARRRYGLEDLEPAAIAKILQHQRMQQTGNEELPLLLQSVAAVSFVGYDGGEVSIWTRSTIEHPEERVLGGLFAAAKKLDRLVTWDGVRRGLPLLRLRALRHDLRAVAFGRLTRADGAGHLDLSRAFGPELDGAASTLAALAAMLELPGLEPEVTPDPWEAWLAGDIQALRRRGEIEGLILYRLALRLWRSEGLLRRADVARLEAALRTTLGRRRAPHLQRMLNAWPAA